MRRSTWSPCGRTETVTELVRAEMWSKAGERKV